MTIYSGLPPYRIGVPHGDIKFAIDAINSTDDWIYRVILRLTFLSINYIKNRWITIYYFLVSISTLFFCYLIII